MKIAEINMLHEGSTGKIMLQIAKCARSAGHEVRTFSPRGFSFHGFVTQPPISGHTYYGSYVSRGIHTVLGMLFGWNGLCSLAATAKLIRELNVFKPDVIHLHNLHQYCVNLPLLFHYIKKKEIRVVWTLHDCWTFTGHCPHFDYIGCEKWKTGCYNCPQLMEYPRSYVDHSKWMYRKKRKWFSGIMDMTLITPSDWLAGLVKQSFLSSYPVKVIHNGIDLDIFHPTPSDFRKKYNCDGKYILLGVAFDWGERKGLDVFVELAKNLDSERYQIVLVGTNDTIDKLLPENIISIHRTQNQKELASIYSAADLFVIPTREDNYPTVNMEAIACGTPVLTFRTGGSPEIIDMHTGSVVDRDDIASMQQEIIRICMEKPYSEESCLKKASEFDMNDRFKEYVNTLCSKSGIEE